MQGLVILVTYHRCRVRHRERRREGGQRLRHGVIWWGRWTLNRSCGSGMIALTAVARFPRTRSGFWWPTSHQSCLLAEACKQQDHTIGLRIRLESPKGIVQFDISCLCRINDSEDIFIRCTKDISENTRIILGAGYSYPLIVAATVPILVNQSQELQRLDGAGAVAFRNPDACEFGNSEGIGETTFSRFPNDCQDIRPRCIRGDALNCSSHATTSYGVSVSIMWHTVRVPHVMIIPHLSQECQ